MHAHHRLSQNLIALALTYTTWRGLFNGTAVFGILLLILGAIYIRDPVPVVSNAKAGVGEFFSSVLGNMLQVARIGHVWIASLNGAATFGVMLALGVVWAPKLLKVHGMSDMTASLGASMLWLGLAAGSAVFPRWSDVIRRRKLPMLVGAAVQLLALLGLVYLPLGTGLAFVLCFIFGFANGAHMLAFSTAADVVLPSQIGTSAAIVNGIMFIIGGVLMARPGVRIALGLEHGIEPASLALAQYAAVPGIAALIIAVVLSAIMKETYPPAQP